MKKKWPPRQRKRRPRKFPVNLEYMRLYEEGLLISDFRAIQGTNERPLSIGFPDLQRHSPDRWRRLSTFKAMKRLKAQGWLTETGSSRFSGKTYCITEVRITYLAKHQKEGAA